MSKNKNLVQIIGEALGARSEEERLLISRRKRRGRYRAHLNSYIAVNLGFYLFCALVAHEMAPAFAISIFWGMGMLIHALNYRNWMQEHQEAFKEAEARLKLEGKTPLALIEGERPEKPVRVERPVREKLPKGGSYVDPLMARCEQAATQTRERLDGVGPGEVEALAVVDEGLQRVRELLARRSDIALVLDEAGGEDLVAERARLEGRLYSSQDPETKTLYQSQLELLEARVKKVQFLQGLQERTLAYAESYLAALTNLRMDAARLKTLELPQSVEMAQLMQPVRALEQQVDGMRVAMAEVARAVKPIAQ